MTEQTGPRTAHLDAAGDLLPKDERERERRIMRLKAWHPRTLALVGQFDFFERMTKSALEGYPHLHPGKAWRRQEPVAAQDPTPGARPRGGGVGLPD